MAYSADDASWTTLDVSSTVGSYNFNSIAFGNNRFVVVGWNGKMAYCDW